MQPAVTAALLQRLADRPAVGDEHPAARALTTREAEILELMAGGFANREIARTESSALRRAHDDHSDMPAAGPGGERRL